VVDDKISRKENTNLIDDISNTSEVKTDKIVRVIRRNNPYPTLSDFTESLKKTEKNGESSEYYFTFDGHGSTRVLTDIAGAILQIYSFDAYGNALGFNPAEALTEFLYSGEQFDSKIGQQYLRQRYYDSTTGRFNRLDPFFGNLNDPLSLHKYLYTHGDPINRFDPSGMMSLGGAMMSGAIIGGISGMSIGAVYGGYRSMHEHGTIWGIDTLKFAMLGGVGGALIGAAAGGAVYLGPHFFNFIASGRSYYLSKILARHSTSEIFGGIGFLAGFYQGLYEDSSLFSALVIPTATVATYTIEYIVQSTILHLDMLMLSASRSMVNTVRQMLISRVQSFTFIGTYFVSGYCAGYFTGAITHLVLQNNNRGPIRDIFENAFTCLNSVEIDTVLTLVENFDNRS
jgi:RHS repeat-associated protein